MSFNKEGNSQTSSTEFINISIREYVAQVRQKDWKKCWPFGPLGDFSTHVDLVLDSKTQESIFFSSQNCPIDASDGRREFTEALNSPEVEIPKGIEPISEETPPDMIAAHRIDEMGNRSSDSKDAQCPNEQSINTQGATISDEPKKNLRRKKQRRFLLLSNLLKKCAGPSGDLDTTNADDVSGEVITETDDESDNITLDKLFRKRKGVQVIPKSCSTLKEKEKKKKNKKKKRKRKTVEVDEDRRLKPGSEDSQDSALDLGSKSSLIKIGSGEKDMQTTKKRKSSSAEVRPSSSQLLQATNIAPSCLGIEKNTFKMQEDPPPPSWHKNKDVKVPAEVTITEASETANEDSEMEAVKLLARHFIEEENASRPALGVESAEMGLSAITRNVKVELFQGSKRIHATVSNHGKGASPLLILQNKSHNGNQSVESRYGKRSAKVDIMSKNTKTGCACVQKKIRESSTTPDGNKSVPTKQFLRVLEAGIQTQSSSKTHKFTKEKHADLLSWVQRSLGKSVCSINRNPSDFSIPNAKNKFMRGG